MCGIAGVIASDPSRLARIDEMVAALAHRGPDDVGIERLDGAALGHRRLSIIDLVTGHQPMFSVDRAAAIVFNGEIYNFRRLRAELEAEGRVFRTESDTEVVLNLYDRDGDDCVLRLDGMFAFALLDLRRGRLLLARDHMGQKPLFFLAAPGLFAFASEVKGLLAGDFLRRGIDMEALYHYVSLRFIPDQRTLFRSIRKLPAAHRLIYENGEARVERYWGFSFIDKERESDDALLDRLDGSLRETVRGHLVSDVPVGCFLSGGIDSSLITAMAASESAGKLATFSIGVREEKFDELPYARRVAASCGTDHHEEIASADLIRLVPEMVWHMDEPSDPFGVGVYLASRLAARHVKVVLSGDGGDELFAGYDRFAGQGLADRLRIIPPPIRRTVLRGLIDRMPESFAYKSATQKLRWINEMSLLREGERYAESMSFLRFTETAKKDLFTETIRRGLDEIDSRVKILEPFESKMAHDPIDRMLYTDLVTRVPDHLLVIVDRMAMAHGLEVRPPFLEHRMVELAARVPSSLKLRGRTLKYALRMLARRYVDPAIANRPKRGFGFPIAFWMRDELRGFLLHVAERARFVEAGILERETVHRLVREHVDGKRDHNFRLWILLNLEVWHRLYMDGESIAEVTEWIERESAA
ncbi:MAG: asparagine synthase (glutamine-hydrolyzing) [Candidatus Eisenbacteria bacterium]|nr:asparagine synthase (glutamine-hydrolyzing) [Candidatus Eisenbacteria bacterium]